MKPVSGVSPNHPMVRLLWRRARLNEAWVLAVALDKPLLRKPLDEVFALGEGWGHVARPGLGSHRPLRTTIHQQWALRAW
jgi:hypothetical protein